MLACRAERVIVIDIVIVIGIVVVMIMIMIIVIACAFACWAFLLCFIGVDGIILVRGSLEFILKRGQWSHRLWQYAPPTSCWEREHYVAPLNTTSRTIIQ